MKKLILMTAVPGAGKSTWAKQYQSTHPHTYIISSDSIRLELLGAVQNFSNEKLVWDTFRNRISEYASLHDDVTVILDAVNYSNYGRKEYYDLSPQYDKHILVWVKKPLEVLQKQNKQRSQNAWVPEDVVENFFNKFEEPNDQIKSLFEIIIVE